MRYFVPVREAANTRLVLILLGSAAFKHGGDPRGETCRPRNEGDYNVRGELAPPFDAILGDELRRRAAKTDENTQAAIKEALQQRHVQGGPGNEQRPQDVLVGANSPTTPYEVVGWSQINMMGGTGLEPITLQVRPWLLPWRHQPSRQ
jgi:hypothetical protein